MPTTSKGRVSVTVRVRASAEDVWRALTDWESQSAWITATKVRTVDGDGQGVGGRIEAFTGFGRYGFLDTMEVTEWRPPTWCAVRHTGKVVRGTGAFEIVPAADEAAGSTLTWYEDLEIPGGGFGGYGFALIRPAVEFGVLRSLRRFAEIVEAKGDRT
ncbi:MAG TPA: SRPBCC family protein [Actinospica sp.]|nr:SRPBCC family protein [Actinospica sp.]